MQFHETTAHVLSEDDLAGGYDILKNAIHREGMEVTSGGAVVTAEDFKDGAAAVQIEYGVMDGYKAVYLSPIMPISKYLGVLEDIEFERVEQAVVTISVYYDNVLVEKEPVMVNDGESYTRDFSDNVSKGYEFSEITDDTNGVFSYEKETNTLTTTALAKENEYSVSIKFNARVAEYTIRHVFPGLEEGSSQTETKEKQGKLNSLTEAEPMVKEGFTAQPITQVVIEAEGTEVTVNYTRNTYKLNYDSRGGSYIQPKTGMYGETVKAYEFVEAKVCPLEEHTHDDRRLGSKCWRWESNGFLSGSWVLTCNKTEHTHNLNFLRDFSLNEKAERVIP